MINKHIFKFTTKTSNQTALDCLAENTNFSRQKLKQYMQQGCIWLERNSLTFNQSSQLQTYTQRLRRAKKTLNIGDNLHFYFDRTVLETNTLKATLIKDFGDYSIWNKPAGMLSQGSKWGDHCTIYRWAEKHLKPERPALIVHRLDKAANGLIILAHKKKVAAQFSSLFEQRKIDKTYHANVEGEFAKIIPNNEQVLTITSNIDGKNAISHISVLDYDANDNRSTLEVKIETGRKHQIRKHLSEQGHPILGDRLYGSNRNNNNNVDLQLQAVSLAFICPVRSEKRNITLL